MDFNKIFCLKCKTFTDNLNIEKIKTKNNKKMVKAKCSVCGTTKNKFLKTSNNSKGFGIINRMIDILPEMHMETDGPGENIENGEFNNTGKYSYCGPGTKLEKRLKQGYKGVNVLDQACLKHDIAYHNNKDVENRNIADNELARVANEIANNLKLNSRVRNDAKKVAAIMSAKSYFGLGVKSNEL